VEGLSCLTGRLESSPKACQLMSAKEVAKLMIHQEQKIPDHLLVTVEVMTEEANLIPVVAPQRLLRGATE